MRKLFSAALMSSTLGAAAPAPKPAPVPVNENLARVAILDFRDMTGSKDYQYLSNSIALGVDKSMKERFDYNPIPSEVARQRTANLLSDNSLSKDNARQVAEAASADVVIGGTYALASGGNKMIIRVSIYLASTDQYIDLPEFTNPVDSTIFQAIEKVSEKIVAKIKEIASRQQSVPHDDKGKISIQRTAETSWRDKNFEGVFYFNILRDYNQKLADNGSGGMAGALFRKSFDAVPWLHWGLNASLFFHSWTAKTSSTSSSFSISSTTQSFVSGITFEGLLGPHLVLTDRIKLFADGMVGYSPAFMYSNLKVTSVSGLTFVGKLGFQFLIGKYFGLEIYGSYSHFNGMNNTAFIGGGLSLVLAP